MRGGRPDHRAVAPGRTRDRGAGEQDRPAGARPRERSQAPSAGPRSDSRGRSTPASQGSTTS